MQQFTDLSTDGGQTEGHKKRHCRDLFCWDVSWEYSGQINHTVSILLHFNQKLCDVILQNF